MAVAHGDELTPGEEDPFAGLVLDESFVQSARVSEAPARTREAIARYAHLEQPVFGAGRPPERARSRRRSWITGTAFVLALAMLGGVVWLTGRPRHSAGSQSAVAAATPAPKPSPSAQSPHVSGAPTPEPSELGNWPRTRTIGECLMWQIHEHAPVSVVPCSKAHVAQVTANLDVKGRFGEAWPGRPALIKVTGDMCQAPFQAFTGLTAQEASVRGYVASALFPSQADWESGGRRVMCTAVRYGTKPFTGSVQNLRKPLTT